jgi:hypothetical protein
MWVDISVARRPMPVKNALSCKKRGPEAGGAPRERLDYAEAERHAECNTAGTDRVSVAGHAVCLEIIEWLTL